MKIKRSISRKLNLGKYHDSLQYENMDIYCELEVEVADEAEAIKASRRLIELCSNEVKQDIANIKNEISSKIKEKANG